MRLSILHWNDVYRVTPQKINTGSNDTIDVTQFAHRLDEIRSQWDKNNVLGLSLFSGDVFSPSVESSITRGSHMVPVMNELAPDVSLTGNHDFDFGYPHLTELIKDMNFPWLLSNIVDTETSKIPEHLQEYVVIERGELKIGVIGLVEKEWIGTVSSWPSNFEYRDMAEVGLELSKKLRDLNGEYKCDLIIALTHCRIPNDITLAKKLSALSSSAQEGISLQHGVDILLGGHDHLYYISKGVDSWEQYNKSEEVLGAENDHGDVLVIKSGTDFRDLSEIDMELELLPETSIRRYRIRAITGRRHIVQPDFKSSERLKKILATQLSGVSKTMNAPICKLAVDVDVRSQFIRTSESAAGNWFADVIRHSYDDTLCMKGCGGADGVFICAGTLRGDSIYNGVLTLGNLMEILPFEDPIVVLELDGASIWDALESSLATWPAQEGRFPAVSGFHVLWDSRKPPGKRVQRVCLAVETDEVGSQHSLIEGDEVQRVHGGRKYKILTREYMAQGHDGFEALKGQSYLVDDESGQMFSTLVRRYLMGCHFVNKMVRIAEEDSEVDHSHFHEKTQQAIEHERYILKAREERSIPRTRALAHWKQAFFAIRRSKAHYEGRFGVVNREHMNGIDPYDGKAARCGMDHGPKSQDVDDDLPTVSPIVDGRLRDEGRD